MNDHRHMRRRGNYGVCMCMCVLPFWHVAENVEINIPINFTQNQKIFNLQISLKLQKVTIGFYMYSPHVC